jgi:hypothetical protein
MTNTFIAKINKPNTMSHFVSIPNWIIQSLNLEKDQLVKITIEPEIKDTMMLIHCPACNSEFVDDQKEIYDCTICGQEVLAIEGELEEVF